VLILKEVKVLCFDTLLEVLIVKTLRFLMPGSWNRIENAAGRSAFRGSGQACATQKQKRQQAAGATFKIDTLT
jgi:hypothetical protein